MNKSEIKPIFDFSRAIYAMNEDPKILFDHIDQLPATSKQELFDKYKDGSGPILDIRKQLAQQILKGTADRPGIQAQFEVGKRNSPKIFTQYKNLYAVLYPFVLQGKNDMIYRVFEDLANNLRDDLELTEKTSIKVVGFDGAMNTGADRAWVAIYNNSFPNQQGAKQLFFSLQNGQFSYGLYDRPSDKMIGQAWMTDETFDYDSMLGAFTSNKQTILDNNARAELLSRYPIHKLIQNLENGAIRFWVFKPGKGANMWRKFLDEANIRIGWGAVIERIYEDNDFTDAFVLDALRENYPPAENQTNNKGSILSFLKEMKIGDIVVATSGVTKLIGMGVITSDVILDEEDEEYKGTRNVDWLIDLHNRPYSPNYQFPQKTTTEYAAKDGIAILQALFPDTKILTEQKIMNSYFVNTILYGPPGTGKTYRLNQLKQQFFTDVIPPHHAEEALREIIQNWPYWEVIAAILYIKNAFVSVNDICDDPLYQAKFNPANIAKPRNIAWAQLQAYANDASTNVAEAYRRQLQIFEKNEAAEWRIIPAMREELPNIIDEDLIRLAQDPQEAGAGAPLDKERYRFITFHQKYSYEDFVEGIRPVVAKAGLEAAPAGLQFQLAKGIFYTACLEALQLAGYANFEACKSATKEERKRKFQDIKSEPGKQFALFIDEINRANISAVFGELITLIEKDKRIGGDAETWVKLPVSGDDFCVPPNLQIIGSMNTADKSIALIDIALRRRFEFIALYPNYFVDGDSTPWWSALLQRLNEVIYRQKNRNADYFVGHAFFLGEPEANRASVFNTKIIPLLMEYFQNNSERVASILQEADVPFRRGDILENYQIIAE